MLIIGSKGYAKEILQHFHDTHDLENLFFYDDISADIPILLFNRFNVLRTLDEAKELFENYDNRYTLGIGNPKARYLLSKKMNSVGGNLCNLINKGAEIGSYNVVIGIGVNIMSGTIITNDIVIGDGVLINLNCTIGHDSLIGNYCELSPGVHISGRVTIGDFCSIGTGAVVIPDIKIGKNCIIGAGSVVNKDIADNSIAVGVPAKVIGEVELFEM